MDDASAETYAYQAQRARALGVLAFLLVLAVFVGVLLLGLVVAPSAGAAGGCGGG